MDFTDLSIFVEFGVGLAGFSGVVVAFGLRSDKLNEFDKFRVVMLLSFALLPAFVSTLPMVLAGFGIVGTETWRIMGAVLVLGLAALSVLPIILARRMSPDITSRLSSVVWVIGLGGTVLAFVWNGLNLKGWPNPFSLGPVLATMVWLLFLASLMFLRLLLVRIGDLGNAEP